MRNFEDFKAIKNMVRWYKVDENEYPIERIREQSLIDAFNSLFQEAINDWDRISSNASMQCSIINFEWGCSIAIILDNDGIEYHGFFPPNENDGVSRLYDPPNNK